MNTEIEIIRIKKEFQSFMKDMEIQLNKDIANAITYNTTYPYLLGRGYKYKGICPCRKNKFELKPDNAIHIILSNNIYSVWFECQKVLKTLCNIDLFDDFISYYNLLHEDYYEVGCLGRKKRIHREPISFGEIIDNYILQYQLEREDGFYVIKKTISFIEYGVI